MTFNEFGILEIPKNIWDPFRNANPVSPEASASTGMTAVQGFMVGTALMGVVDAFGRMFTAGWQAEAQKTQLNIQRDSAVSRGKFTREMMETEKNSQLARLESQRIQQEITSSRAEDMNAALENRKEAEDGLIIAKAEIKESKRTEETWQKSSRQLDNYFYGTPV